MKKINLTNYKFCIQIALIISLACPAIGLAGDSSCAWESSPVKGPKAQALMNALIRFGADNGVKPKRTSSGSIQISINNLSCTGSPATNIFNCAPNVAPNEVGDGSDAQIRRSMALLSAIQNAAGDNALQSDGVMHELFEELDYRLSCSEKVGAPASVECVFSPTPTQNLELGPACPAVSDQSSPDKSAMPSGAGEQTGNSAAGIAN
jgi:hypothetical protein